jgi:hypothetical protein
MAATVLSISAVHKPEIEKLPAIFGANSRALTRVVS